MMECSSAVTTAPQAAAAFTAFVVIHFTLYTLGK